MATVVFPFLFLQTVCIHEHTDFADSLGGIVLDAWSFNTHL